MARSDREWTTPEIAAHVGWRATRYGQTSFSSPELADEFGGNSNTIAAMFGELSSIVVVTRSKDGQTNLFTISGEMTPANGKAYRPVQGAFAFAYILGRDYWAVESELERLAKWSRDRVRQMVKYKLRTLPLWRRSRLGDALYVDIDCSDAHPQGERSLDDGACTRCGWPPRDFDNPVSGGLCSWCRIELSGEPLIRC